MSFLLNKSKGYTFLELILALAIFSAGVLGLLQMQALVQRQLQESQTISLAVMQAYYLSALFSSFSSATLNDLTQQWQARLAQLLPSGAGEITATEILVTWHSPLSSNGCGQDHLHCVRLMRE